jgi:hypothetical protein
MNGMVIISQTDKDISTNVDNVDQYPRLKSQYKVFVYSLWLKNFMIAFNSISKAYGQT